MGREGEGGEGRVEERNGIYWVIINTKTRDKTYIFLRNIDRKNGLT